MQNKVLNIKPISKRNSLFLITLGTLLLGICFTLNYWFWDDFKIQLTLIMLASGVVFFIGVLKKLEPEFSIKLTPKMMIYYHRCGSWQVRWQDITRFGRVGSNMLTQRVELSFIGIRLNNIQCIADNISPRLANRLLHEQKELLAVAIRSQDITLQQAIIDFAPYTLDNKQYKGPVAAWLYRTEVLLKAYGYHLYLPEDSLDREIAEFITLLNQCKNYSVVQD